MKFGKQLEAVAKEKYKGQYVEYKEFKKAIRYYCGEERDTFTVQEVTHWTSSFLRLGPNPKTNPQGRMSDLLTMQLDRINKFVKLQSEALQKKIRELDEDLARGRNGKGDLEKRLSDLGSEVVDLQEFTMMNATAFRKLLKKYDKANKETGSTLHWWMAEVRQASFMNVPWDNLLAILNKIAVGMCEPAKDDAQSSEEMREVVLWIEKKDTMKLKVNLCIESGYVAASSNRSVSETFFDNDKDFGGYNALLNEAKTGSTLRLRFYDDARSAQDPVLLVFKETPGVGSSKEVLISRQTCQSTSALTNGVVRALTPTDGKDSYPPGLLPPLSSAPAAATISSAQRAISSQRWRPMVKCNFKRSAFSRGDRVEILVDEDVCFAQLQPDTDPLAGGLSYIDALWNVVTIRMPDGAAKPVMLQGCSEVPTFTNAALAMAYCYANLNSLATPSWFTNAIAVDFGDEARSSTHQEDGDEEVKKDVLEKEKDDRIDDMQGNPVTSPQAPHTLAGRLKHEWAAQSGRLDLERESYQAPAPSGGGLSAPLLARDPEPQTTAATPSTPFLTRLRQCLHLERAPQTKTRSAIVKVEPKALYANERTFLEWMHFAVLLALAGVACLYAAPSRTMVYIGRTALVMSSLLIGWSLHIYTYRAQALNMKEIQDYKDHVGPPLLVGSLIIGLIVLGAEHLANM
mmetsp:Transcript_3683/g.9357  ORF Transcript_3683/g.9357 Transcript_3683/m.9357 type:complete len:686 (+) Transcript_3683:50-2107(+)